MMGTGARRGPGDTKHEALLARGGGDTHIA